MGYRSGRGFERNHLVLAQFNDRIFYFSRTQKKEQRKTFHWKETATTSTSVCCRVQLLSRAWLLSLSSHYCLAVGAEHLAAQISLPPFLDFGKSNSFLLRNPRWGSVTFGSWMHESDPSPWENFILNWFSLIFQ